LQVAPGGAAPRSARSAGCRSLFRKTPQRNAWAARGGAPQNVPRAAEGLALLGGAARPHDRALHRRGGTEGLLPLRLIGWLHVRCDYKLPRWDRPGLTINWPGTTAFARGLDNLYRGPQTAGSPRPGVLPVACRHVPGPCLTVEFGAGIVKERLKLCTHRRDSVLRAAPYRSVDHMMSPTASQHAFWCARRWTGPYIEETSRGRGFSGESAWQRYCAFSASVTTGGLRRTVKQWRPGALGL
jgi:hypothetical protein